MKHIVLYLSVLSLFAAGPALAAGDSCSTAPKSSWKPQSALKTQLKAQGLEVRRIKTEGGCYEVYAVDKDGKRLNAAYNAETLTRVSNAEAGEE